MELNRIAYLFEQYEADKITDLEKEELYSLLRSFDNNDDILAWLESSYQNTIPQTIHTERWTPVLDHILSLQQQKLIPLYPRKTRYMRWIAAAAVIILIAALAVVGVLTNNHRKVPQPTAQTHDVAPGSFKARLTLADGTVIVLDSASAGELTKQGSVAVINKDGKLVYQAEKEGFEPSVNAFNTLSTAKGESYSVTLSDGTKVWLNAASSIKYPVAFNNKERRVEITGEAYFEVKHNAAKPFKVLVNGIEVEDIGTEFNINAYPDEPVISTTLVSGEVRVRQLSPASGGGRRPEVDLKPGEQAVASSNAALTIHHSPDIDKITAWKNNEFNFSDDDIQTIMRQLARWYNIQPVITAPSDTQYTGRITRNVPLSEVLKMFERVGYVKFEISGRVVKVIPINSH